MKEQMNNSAVYALCATGTIIGIATIVATVLSPNMKDATSLGFTVAGSAIAGAAGLAKSPSSNQSFDVKNVEKADIEK